MTVCARSVRCTSPIRQHIVRFVLIRKKSFDPHQLVPFSDLPRSSSREDLSLIRGQSISAHFCRVVESVMRFEGELLQWSCNYVNEAAQTRENFTKKGSSLMKYFYQFPKKRWEDYLSLRGYKFFFRERKIRRGNGRTDWEKRTNSEWIKAKEKCHYYDYNLKIQSLLINYFYLIIVKYCRNMQRSYESITIIIYTTYILYKESCIHIFECRNYK